MGVMTMKKILLFSMLFLFALVTSVSAALTTNPTTLDLGTVAVDVNTDGTKSVAFTVASDVAAGESIASAAVSVFTLTGGVGTFTPTVSVTSPTLPKTVTTAETFQVAFTIAKGAVTAGTYTGNLQLKDGSGTVLKSVPVTVIISTTHNVVVDGLTSISVNVDYSNLQQKVATFNTTKSVVIKNTGVFSEQVTLAFTAAKTDFTGTLSAADSSFTLATGASKTVTLNVGLPLIASGTTKLGTLDIKFNTAQTTTPVDVNAVVKTMLEITDLEVDIGEEDDSNVEDGEEIDAEGQPEDKVVMNFKVDNLFDKDYDLGDFEDVEINIKINDNEFGDDIDEDSDEFNLDAGEDKDDVDITFDIPDDAEDGTYEISIELSGVLETTGVRHTFTMDVTLEINLESDDVRISSIEPNPLTLQCNRDATISIRVRNHGTDNQDDVTISVDGSALGIDEDFSGIELDELGESNDDERKEFSVSLDDDLAAGTYNYDVRVFRDGDELEDEERGTIRVEDCGPRSTSGSSNGATVVVQPPVITQPVVTQPTTPTGAVVVDDDFVDSVETPFTQSPLFLVLLVLGNVIVLGLIVFIIVKVAAK